MGTHRHIEDKVSAIRECFASMMGTRIVKAQTAELLLHDGSWDAWSDLGIRLIVDAGDLVVISWLGFDDLWLAKDESLPFQPEDTRIRWVDSEIAELVGCTLQGVALGRGEMSVEGRDIEVWTRLLIEFDDRHFEIYNTLDDNGYALHSRRPVGEFKDCV